MSKEAYVYIMASRSLTLYIGMTTNLDGRILEYREGLLAGFSKDYRCTRLVYYEIFDVRLLPLRVKNNSRVGGVRRSSL